MSSPKCINLILYLLIFLHHGKCSMATLSATGTMTSENEIVKDCSKPGHLVIKGDFIKFSDFVQDDGKLINFCENSTRLKSIDIFSLNTVVINGDLNAVGDQLVVAVVAPKWEIIGNRKIMLDGNDDEKKPKSKDQPGRSAGSFFGIGSESQDSLNLTITANAGIDGGNGGKILLISLKDTLTVQPTGNNHEKSGRDFNQENAATGSDAPKSVSESVSVLNPVEIIDEYKKFLRENVMIDSKREAAIQLLSQFNENNKIIKLYGTAGIVNNFFVLEDQFYAVNKDSNFLPYYESLLKGIIEYAKNPNDDENSVEIKKVLNYLYTAILTEMYNLKDKLKSDLIINIREYLNSVEKNFKSIEDIKEEHSQFINIMVKLNNIDEYNKNYNENIGNKIKEAENIIVTDVLPKINNNYSQIKKLIESLVTELIYLQKNAGKENKEFIIKKREELVNALIFGDIYSAIKLLATGLNFLGPVGTATGSAIAITRNVAESLLLDKISNTKSQITELPKNVTSELKWVEKQIENIEDQESKTLDELLGIVSKEMKEFPDQLRNILKKLDEIKPIFNKTKNIDKVYELREELKQILESEKAALIMQNTTSSSPKDKEIQKIEKCLKIVNFGAAVIDLYVEHNDSQSKIDVVNETIEQADAKFDKLLEYRKEIDKIMISTFKNLKNNVHRIISNLTDNSQISFTVTQRQVKDVLGNIKLQIEKFAEGFQIKNYLSRSVKILEEVMIIFIDVYDHIQDYRERQNLANYKTNLISVTAGEIIVSDKYKDVINRLKIKISSNLILQQYQTAKDAFKQFVFPFADQYFQKWMIPSHLELDDNIENSISKAATSINKIRWNLNYRDQYRSYQYLSSGTFSSGYVSTEPFHVWENENNGDLISKLLSGEEIAMVADTMETNFFYQFAIKINWVALNFKLKNESEQSEINEKLKSFKITLKHLGNSYYRYDENIYMIPTSFQNIWYNFECNSSIILKPTHFSDSYEKIKNGDLMLSPYALWKISLAKVSDSQSFDELQTYIGKIDLELVGDGFFVYDLGNLPDFELQKFYDVIQRRPKVVGGQRN